jgi:3-hydroxymyristoyl/3-hydroxydecanoyl-(acyl carrier protein) dehydratase
MIEPKTLLNQAVRASERLSGAHSAFLENRASGLHELANLIALELGQPPVAKASRPALFDRAHLEEFATGSIARCFGPEYAIFESHRYPRIPNGALLLMDQVTDIQGTRHQLKPGASISTEYTVPSTAWFGSQPGQPVPYFTLMEMALQPCGLLSAYLGTAFIFPGEDYYFRNLDGQAVLLSEPNLHGQQITANARLTSSTTSGSTIIQKFDFSLSRNGQVFFKGDSAFGYFPATGLASQAGLDSGREVPPVVGWDPQNTTQFPKGSSQKQAALPLLDQILVTPQGGRAGLGSLWAEKMVNPQDWFFDCHFFQDPVMPGSLGLEAIFQGLLNLVIQSGQIRPGYEPRFTLHQPLAWKYRGQILRSHKRMQVEVNLENVEATPEFVSVKANASLWGDRTRIYEVKNLALNFPLP